MAPSVMSDIPLLQVTELRHSYGDKQVLSLDTWQLLTGEHQLLLGPSGSGKTTLLGILSGLLSPSEGTINAMGRDVGNMTLSELSSFRARNFGFVFQDHHLVSSLSVEENLRLARHLANLPADQDWENQLFDRLGLTSLRTSKPASLSHGEAQRAAIARAAVTRPKLLLADEPTSALDDDNTQRVMALLKSLSEQAGSTMLVASHDSRLKPFFERTFTLSKLEERIS
ncbi:MAG: ATP-binding cassette domain-containing protein [Kordiimonadaceae bacterium]|nr:ATP-binding cassette domain-containing protein [Kordiimonadaceae bacterium]MBO6964785.1 ATP-binding cassette domain-containing protein [Kordiimonadaceae bacterium]